MSKAFRKFIDTKDKGAKKKEAIRQEKKAQRQETAEYFKAKKIEAKQLRAQSGSQESAPRANESTKYQPEDGRVFKRDDRKGGRKKEDARSPKIMGDKKLAVGESKSRVTISKTEKTSNTSKGEGYAKPAAGARQPLSASKPVSDDKKVAAGEKKQLALKSAEPAAPKARPVAFETKNIKPGSIIPLNKFLAHSGISARRGAADIVKSGVVTVNGAVVKEPGFKVSDKDVIKVNGKPATIRRTMVYILLNKPKDFITTTEDPEGRKTVMDIVKSATDERVYPIGRLDRNTTGVLLLTNDGELTQKLAHPSYEVKKIYEVKLDKPLVKKDFDAILAGIKLEDGLITPDVLAYADPKDKTIIGIEIHSGRNRIVRRIFEHLGYDVRNLDRVMYANLTKKNVDRGKWRFLTEKEVRLLKFLNASYTNKSKKPARG